MWLKLGDSFIKKVSPVIFNKNKKGIRRRYDVILVDDVGLVVAVYNGRDFKKVKVVSEMIGFKYGSFSFTRKVCKYKVKKKKKKIEKKNG